MSDVDQLHRTIRNLVGDDLRAVIRFDRGSFEITYSRHDLNPGDLREGFAASQDEFIIRQMQLDDDGAPGLVAGQRIDNATDVPCLSYWTREAIIFHLPRGRYSGVVVSIEHDTDVAVSNLCEAFDQSLVTA